MATTPDFDTYPRPVHVVGATRVAASDPFLAVGWSDGTRSRFHDIWLRDNCPCADCVNEITREQTFEITSAPPEIRGVLCAASANGDLYVRWSQGNHASTYDAGWLHAHRYDAAEAEVLRPRTEWDASSLLEPPTFDAEAVIANDSELYRWLCALWEFGCARLCGLDCVPDAVGDVALRIGPLRDTNFGRIWDVRSEDDPISNANTSLPLPPHVDLPTREYQPGLQFLHCLVNDATGGESVVVDGIRVAGLLRAESAEHYRIMTTVPWNWANRSRTTDHRWASPLVVLDDDGSVRELRVGNWLRAPLHVPFAQTESAYAAYRHLSEIAMRESLQLRFRLVPGDVIVFDNRRLLHGRTAFVASGRRHLRGCYSEREELSSRLRVLERAARSGSV